MTPVKRHTIRCRVQSYPQDSLAYRQLNVTTRYIKDSVGKAQAVGEFNKLHIVTLGVEAARLLPALRNAPSRPTPALDTVS